jgi:hypothetical protein
MPCPSAPTVWDEQTQGGCAAVRGKIESSSSEYAPKALISCSLSLRGGWVGSGLFFFFFFFLFFFGGEGGRWWWYGCMCSSARTDTPDHPVHDMLSPDEASAAWIPSLHGRVYQKYLLFLRFHWRWLVGKRATAANKVEKD